MSEPTKFWHVVDSERGEYGLRLDCEPRLESGTWRQTAQRWYPVEVEGRSTSNWQRRGAEKPPWGWFESAAAALEDYLEAQSKSAGTHYEQALRAQLAVRWCLQAQNMLSLNRPAGPPEP